MKTVLFARVSSREQEETGYSLPSQEKLLKEHAERKGLVVARRFSISESASGRNQRKTFEEMMEYVKKNNIKVIVCEKVDRLTRNLKDAVSINEWINGDPEREVHFVKENCVLNKNSRSNEKFIWNIKVSVAQYYIDNLSEEVKKGQKEKIAQGWLPAKPPLGYKTVGERGHKIHVIDEEKAPLIRKMFELYATGEYSLKKLVETMYESGLRTRGGNKLVKSRLAELLSDPFYCGKIQWNDQVYDGRQEGLITKEVFDRVQDVLRSKNTPKYSKHFYLFKGLIRCGECNGIITWEGHKGIVYGHCNYYRNCSQTVWVKENEIVDQIKPIFGRLRVRSARFADWMRKALKESHKDQVAYRESATVELERQVKRAQKRLEALYDDKLDGKIDNDLYERKFRQYTAEKERAIEAMQRHSNADTKYYELGISIFELSQIAEDAYEKASNDEKRKFMNLMLDSMSLRDGILSGTYSKPFEILYRAVTAVNGSKAADLAKMGPKIFEPANLGSNKAKSATFSGGFRPQLLLSDGF